MKQNIRTSLLVLILGVVGCQQENVPRTFAPEVMQKHASFKDLYAKSHGQWSQLSPAEQKQFATDWTHGDLGSAEVFWQQEGKDEAGDNKLDGPPGK